MLWWASICSFVCAEFYIYKGIKTSSREASFRRVTAYFSDVQVSVRVRTDTENHENNYRDENVSLVPFVSYPDDECARTRSRVSGDSQGKNYISVISKF